MGISTDAVYTHIYAWYVLVSVVQHVCGTIANPLCTAWDQVCLHAVLVYTQNNVL